MAVVSTTRAVRRVGIGHPPALLAARTQCPSRPRLCRRTLGPNRPWLGRAHQPEPALHVQGPAALEKRLHGDSPLVLHRISPGGPDSSGAPRLQSDRAGPLVVTREIPVFELFLSVHCECLGFVSKKPHSSVQVISR